jgi:IS605 OrfB family transposase
LKIKLKPCYQQRKILDEWINTSNYVYNKTIESINNGDKINFMSLRDKLVTKHTKKRHVKYIELADEINKLKQQKNQMSLEDTSDLSKIISNKKFRGLGLKKLRNIAKTLPKEHNVNVKDWECNTPKEVRAGAVNDVCKAYKTGFANLKAGNINYFRLGFRKHYNTTKSAVIPKSFVSVRNGSIRIAPDFFKDKCEFRIGGRTLKKHILLEINNDCRILKKNGDYWIVIPVITDVKKRKTPLNYCGVDPGSRTFMTTFGNLGCNEYKHNQDLLDKVNKRIRILKSFRTRPRQQKERNKYRKRALTKVENYKSNLIDELHWKTITHLLKVNDFVFYGNIKSHGIVKNGVNKHLNRNLNDLKLYKFKERLLYKAIVFGKHVLITNESYTTQTCSCCGNVCKQGSSEVYNCLSCLKVMGRDVNASKNILMKGIVDNLS